MGAAGESHGLFTAAMSSRRTRAPLLPVDGAGRSSSRQATRRSKTWCFVLILMIGMGGVLYLIPKSTLHHHGPDVAMVERRKDPPESPNPRVQSTGMAPMTAAAVHCPDTDPALAYAWM